MLAKDVATVALLVAGMVAIVAVMLLMVYVWRYVLAAAVLAVALMALRRSRG